VLIVLSLLQAAISLDSRNPLARFELAGVLMAQERLQDALQEMQELAVSSCRR
jgi:cytochrome c-type biogenesis protein CcmH/NrfG